MEHIPDIDLTNGQMVNGTFYPFCDLTYNASYRRENGSGCFDCFNRYHFNFTSLQTITSNIYSSCPNDSRLARLADGSVRLLVALTGNACEFIAGTSWTRYPWIDIWTRLTTWKVPLVLLAAQFPKPPFSKKVEVFVTARVLGNPIATLQDLIVKFASCQGRALYWQKRFATANFGLGDVHSDNEFALFERYWKAFAIIVDSCDEWGLEQGDFARDTLDHILVHLAKLEEDAEDDERLKYNVQVLRTEFIASCLQTAKNLAADRATTLFPVVVTLFIFVFSFIAAFVRISISTGSNQTMFVNVEAYSVAFSATYFWILSVIVLGAAIGSSQTALAVPRILNGLQNDLRSITGEPRITILQAIEENFGSAHSFARTMEGGVYSWQPCKWSRYPFGTSPALESIKSELWAHEGYSSSGSTKTQGTKVLRKSSESVRSIDVEAQRTVSVTMHVESVEHAKEFAPNNFDQPSAPYTLSQSSSQPEETHNRQTAEESSNHVPPRDAFESNDTKQTSAWGHVWRYTRPVWAPLPGSPIFPMIVVFLPMAAAWIISAEVPPEGWGCRPEGEMALFSIWLSAYLLDFIVHPSLLPNSPTLFFSLSWAKDSLSVLVSFGYVIATQWGIFNSCTCYTNHSGASQQDASGFLVLPGSVPVSELLDRDMSSLYLTIVLVIVLVQLCAVPAVVLWEYFDAWRVFVQRDDGTSYFDALQRWRRRTWPRPRDPDALAKMSSASTLYRRLSGLPSPWPLSGSTDVQAELGEVNRTVQSVNQANATLLTAAASGT